MSSLWPIGLIVLAAVGITGYEAALACQKSRGLSWGSLRVLRSGLQRTLQFMVVTTFLLVPGIATQIFKTFNCESFEYDGDNHLHRRYLFDDLSQPCTGDQYKATRATALVMVGLWPIGCLPPHCPLAHNCCGNERNTPCSFCAAQRPVALWNATPGKLGRPKLWDLWHNSTRPCEGIPVGRLQKECLLVGAD
jgi:hypothetical protein